MNKIIKTFFVYIIILILTLSAGIILSFKNTDDYFVTELEFEELSADVKVYRDEYGVPTIIAENTDDLFFAQGYEFARDRLWQAEFYRSIANGELSRLFGEDLLDSDRFLRTLQLKEAASLEYANTSPETKKAVNRYIEGLNKYRELHLSNLPLEFEMLGLGELLSGTIQSILPKAWEPEDVLALQGVMSFDLSFAAVDREILRQDLLLNFGAERALELIPIHNPEAESYFQNINVSDISPLKIDYKKSFPLLNEISQVLDKGSNSWAISGDLTESGNPLLANDPHLGLATPSIWWQVHLYTTDGTYQVEGFSLPGTPGIVVGHNKDVAWGVTNTGTDSIDLFYFNTRTDSSGNEQYFIDGIWKNFETDIQQIPIAGGKTDEFILKQTDYGPVLDKTLFNITDDKTYAMRWVLLETISNSSLFDAILGLNYAQNAQDIFEAANYWSVPGQNLVFATVEGDIGYQYTGFAPIRKTIGSGVLPQNGSDSNFGWDGYVPYSEQFRVLNPVEGYIVTANAKVDKTDNFYITDLYSTDYRTERITQLITQGNNYDIDYMLKIQSDIMNLYAVDVLDPLLQFIDLTGTQSDLTLIADEALEILSKWDHLMDKDSVGATIFATFRIFLEEYTFKDELDSVKDIPYLYEKYSGFARYPMPTVAKDVNSIWFDDVSTTEINETGAEIASKAFNSAIEFLNDELGSEPSKWEWGRLHKVIFEHPIGDNAPFVDFNEGNIANSGSSFTVKAAGGTPSWTPDGPNFIQTNGQSFRFIAEVESSWSNTWGIVAPGESGSYNSENRGDSVEDWVDTINHRWEFSVELKSEPTFTFRKK